MALSVAARNAALNSLSEKVVFICSDWCSSFSGSTQFDFIVSNPPYIKTDVISGLQPEVSIYEPRDALDGGADGLFCIKRIINTAFDHIRDGGFLMMEIGYDQGDEVRKLLNGCGLCKDAEIIKDLSGHDRVAYAVSKGR
jgi:release factor glutamine methyltransferase